LSVVTAYILRSSPCLLVLGVLIVLVLIHKLFIIVVVQRIYLTRPNSTFLIVYRAVRRHYKSKLKEKLYNGLKGGTEYILSR